MRIDHSLLRRIWRRRMIIRTLSRYVRSAEYTAESTLADLQGRAAISKVRFGLLQEEMRWQIVRRPMSGCCAGIIWLSREDTLQQAGGTSPCRGQSCDYELTEQCMDYFQTYRDCKKKWVCTPAMFYGEILTIRLSNAARIGWTVRSSFWLYWVHLAIVILVLYHIMQSHLIDICLYMRSICTTSPSQSLFQFLQIIQSIQYDLFTRFLNFSS
jgi:hypothetical protein